MVMVDLDSVYKVTAKGKTYYYAWRGKGAPRLRGEPGSASFIADLAEALASRKAGDKRLLSGLCAAYRASDPWKQLSAKTRKNWSPWLDRIQIEFGKLSVAQFDRAQMRSRIRIWRDQYSKTPRTADVALQVFSRLLSFGVAEGLLTLNIITAIPRLYRNDRSEVIWTDDDLAALEKVGAPEIVHAAKLAIYTGLRQGDLLRLCWTHIGSNAIEIKTSKTGEYALVPMHGELKKLLGEIPKRAATVLTSSTGHSWGTGFGASWQRVIKRAKVDKHFHDLRGTAATKLFMADLTPREIAEVMGWAEDHVEAILNRYVKRDELLRDRIRRMDEAEARTKSAKPDAKPSASEG